VNFLVDAQLPIRLANWISAQGFDCKHVIHAIVSHLENNANVLEISKAELTVHE